MKLSELCEIKTGFPDADFWIVRRGSLEAVGTPTREYGPEKIGVKVIRTDILVPNYLFYMIQYLHSRDVFKQMAKGALRLVNITTDDIKKIPVSVG
jgi:hypothetical protein